MSKEKGKMEQQKLEEFDGDYNNQRTQELISRWAEECRSPEEIINSLNIAAENASKFIENLLDVHSYYGAAYLSNFFRFYKTKHDLIDSTRRRIFGI